MQSRIREIRKAKGMTLQQVADKIGTTAQTIGRLETGMRTLSIRWVNRIAEALGCDPGELLALPEGGDVPVIGNVGTNGHVESGPPETIIWRVSDDEIVAIKLLMNSGPFRAGDYLIFEKAAVPLDHVAAGRYCLVESGKAHVFCRAMGARSKPVDGFAVCGTSELLAPDSVSNIQLAIRSVTDLTAWTRA